MKGKRTLSSVGRASRLHRAGRRFESCSVHMKVISLNIWGGSLREPLMEFLRHHAPSIDVFCLQEVSSSPQNSLLQTLRELLSDFDAHYVPVLSGHATDNSKAEGSDYGQA